jgi:hypothetical protein
MEGKKFQVGDAWRMEASDHAYIKRGEEFVIAQVDIAEGFAVTTKGHCVTHERIIPGQVVHLASLISTVFKIGDIWQFQVNGHSVYAKGHTFRVDKVNSHGDAFDAKGNAILRSRIVEREIVLVSRGSVRYVGN